MKHSCRCFQRTKLMKAMTCDDSVQPAIQACQQHTVSISVKVEQMKRFMERQLKLGLNYAATLLFRGR
jgi:ABC-type branched-subunit amino acid transport system ATPase component